MADNIGYTPGSGATVAADEVGGALHQRVKLSIGADGAAADLAFGQVAMTSSLPVTLANNQNTLPVGGSVAHNGVAADNPLQLGGFAINAEAAVVANADVAHLVCDLAGKLITLPYANPENFVKGKTAAITTTGRTEVIAAQGVGVRIYVTHILVTNSAPKIGTYVKIEDGTTEIYGGYAANAGGGFSITCPVPLQLTANTALNVSCVTTAASVYVSASGYKGV